MRSIFAFLLAVCFLLTVMGAVLLVKNRLPQGMERRSVVVNGRSVTLDIINLTEQGYSFEMGTEREDPKPMSVWRESRSADIVFTGAYFDENLAPTGYYATGNQQSVIPWPTVEDQRDEASYSFLIRIIEGRLTLFYLPDAPQEEAPEDAFLSFPTLVAAGLPVVKADSGVLARRTMLAEAKDGDVYLLVTEKGMLSLFEAAELLASQPEEFVLGGNLDGGPSTGLSLTDGRRVFDEPSAPVPNVIIGER